MNIIPAYKQLIQTVLWYFSTALLFRTFFTPWRRYYWKKTSPGLHVSETVFIILSNLASRLIGMGLRTIMISLGCYLTLSAVVFGIPIVLLLRILAPSSFVFNPHKLKHMRPMGWNWNYGYTPTIDAYANELYYQKLDHPLVGKSKEVEDFIRILSQKKGANILIAGEPGSGRSALLTLISHELPFKRFLLFDYSLFFKDKETEQEQKGGFSEALREAELAGNAVLVFEYVERLVPLLSTLEPFLESGKLHIVGITTKTAYHEQLLVNDSFIRHFTVLQIDPLSDKQVFEVLIKTLQTSYHRELPTDTIKTLVTASYNLGPLEKKHQPEAALMLLDEFLVYHDKTLAKDHQHVWKDELQSFLERRLDMPFTSLSANEKENLEHLEEVLHRRIIGQDQAIKQIADAVRRNKAKLTDEHKPIGSFLFLGPTGVGKTETAKTLAMLFFKDEDKLVRFDMAGFNQSNHTDAFVSVLAKRVREDPYAVLLLDELEKAHTDIINMLLTVLDEGYFVDDTDTKILCNNLIIVATSNAASEFIREIVQTSEAAMPTPLQENVTLTQKVIDRILKDHVFSPEFINRFDAVVAFKPLTDAELRTITTARLEALRERVQKTHGKTFEITDELVNSIVAANTRKEFGARELDRTIQAMVENTLAKELLKTKAEKLI